MKNGSTRVGMCLCLARRRRPTRRAIPIGEILEESKFTLIGIIPSALTFDRSPIIVTARRSRGGPGGAIGLGSGSPGSPHPQAGARDDGQRSIVRAIGISPPESLKNTNSVTRQSDAKPRQSRRSNSALGTVRLDRHASLAMTRVGGTPTATYWRRFFGSFCSHKEHACLRLNTSM